MSSTQLFSSADPKLEILYVFRRQSERRRELEPTTGTGNEKRRTLKKSTVTIIDNLTKKTNFLIVLLYLVFRKTHGTQFIISHKK